MPMHAESAASEDPRNAPPHVVLITLEQTTDVMTVLRSDGKVASLPLRGKAFAGDLVASLAYAPTVARVAQTTSSGDVIVSQLPRLGDDVAPIEERPVIYLDQNHWSTLANAIHRPDRITAPDERAAARHLIQLVRDGKVILPMSAGHMSETCKWSNKAQRYNLALTILQLSGGWYMRDPLQVRRLELAHCLARAAHGAHLLQPPTFTLDPDALHGERRDPVATPSDFAGELAHAHRVLTSLVALSATMLDPGAVPLDPVPGWVDWNQRYTNWMATEDRDSKSKHASTEVMFMTDIGTVLAEEAFRLRLTPEQTSRWTWENRTEDVPAMPCLGLYREVLHDKLVNRTTWEDNDLVDMVYLTCAAGYADHVVAERELTGIMTQSLRRLGRPTNVHRNLRTMVNHLA